MPAVLAGAGPHIDHVIGGENRVRVVLDYDDAVAEIPQVLQRREQPVVIALMQTDRRLVEDVHHAGEARADLRRKPDALRLAARERLRRTVQRQVIEPDIVQELQPADDLLDDLVGDRLPLSLELQPTKELAGPLQRPAADLEDRALVTHRSDLDVTRLALEARALALRTRLRVQVLGQLLADHDRVGLAIAPLEIGNDAFESVLANNGLAAIGEILKRNLLLFAAVKDHLLDAIGELVERLFQLESVVLGETLQHLKIELVTAVPAPDRPGRKRQLRKCDDTLGVEETDRAEAVAARASPHRIVEREQARLELLQRVAADRAGELGRIQMLCPGIHLDRDRTPVTVAQRSLE